MQVKSNLTDLIPVQLEDSDGNVLARYVCARQAASGDSRETARISASCRTNAVNPDGTRWRWGTTDEGRIRRIHEICEEINTERADLEFIVGDGNLKDKVIADLPENINDLLTFDKIWEKNRFWKPRIDALKKTYYRPILMIDANTGDVIKEYPSVRQCCMETGLRKGDISLILSGKRRLKSIHGKTFRYKRKKDRDRAARELRDWKAGKREPWKMKKDRKR